MKQSHGRARIALFALAIYPPVAAAANLSIDSVMETPPKVVAYEFPEQADRKRR